MKAVKADFIANPQQNEQGASQPDGQSTNIDERIQFVFDEIAGGDFEVVFEHRKSEVFCPKSGNIKRKA
jgi:hypothetical protein